MFRKNNRRKIITNKKCSFCQKKDEPDYKKPERLAEFVSDRGRILGRDRSGTCASHQRALTRMIKRGRHLGLLPFVVKVR